MLTGLLSSVVAGVSYTVECCLPGAVNYVTVGSEELILFLGSKDQLYALEHDYRVYILPLVCC